VTGEPLNEAFVGRIADAVLVGAGYRSKAGRPA